MRARQTKKNSEIARAVKKGERLKKEKKGGDYGGYVEAVGGKQEGAREKNNIEVVENL